MRSRPSASTAIVTALAALVAATALASWLTGEASVSHAQKGGVPGARPPTMGEAIEELRARHLLIPIDGIRPADLRDSFAEARDQTRQHEALDILAPRNTPVRAVENGTIAKLFTSKAGGITIYEFDPTTRYAYYYAHLQRYADGLKERDAVNRGQIIGYVGTTGNAPPNTPHLHFAIFTLTADKHWWQGTAVDPFLVLH
jgi:murein DD-endopeptidase MepM/ murein hydrolase activator NlpD